MSESVWIRQKYWNSKHTSIWFRLLETSSEKEKKMSCVLHRDLVSDLIWAYGDDLQLRWYLVSELPAI